MEPGGPAAGTQLLSGRPGPALGSEDNPGRAGVGAGSCRAVGPLLQDRMLSRLGSEPPCPLGQEGGGSRAWGLGP